MRRKVMAALCAAALLMATGCTPSPITTVPSASKSLNVVPLTVGLPEVPDDVNPAEGALLANVYAAALNAAGLHTLVAEKPSPAGTMVSGLEAGDYDIVLAYSRAALAELSPEAAEDPAADANKVLSELKAALPDSVMELDPTKVEDQDAMVVTAVTAEKYQLKSITDLARVCGQLTLGGSAQFKTKDTGLPALERDYKCVPETYKQLRPVLDTGSDSVVWSLLRDDIQVADIHASSPAIADNALVALSDPMNIFPAQTIVPLVAGDRAGADAQDVLNKVSAALTTEELSNLNRLAQDRQDGNFAEVAQAWLVQKGLVKSSS